MKPKILLRIAALIMLFHCVGHTVGVLTWQRPNGSIPSEVVQKMQEVQFGFMGKDGSTMANFYSGFGYSATIMLLFIVALLWLLSGMSDKSAAKILWIVAIAIILLSADEMIFFFPMAVTFSLVSAVLVVISIFKINKMTKIV